MTEKEKRKDGPSAQVKLRVLTRDRFTCTYCGAKGADAELQVDHIHPVSKGGSHHMANLTTACRSCNSTKRDKIGVTPTTARFSSWVGLWLHTWVTRDGHSEIQKQGHVIGHDDDDVFVELFNWLDGRPTEVVVMTKDFMRSDAVTLYQNQRQMFERYLDHHQIYGRDRKMELALAGFTD